MKVWSEYVLYNLGSAFRNKLMRQLGKFTGISYLMRGDNPLPKIIVEEQSEWVFLFRVESLQMESPDFVVSLQNIEYLFFLPEESYSQLMEVVNTIALDVNLEPQLMSAFIRGDLKVARKKIAR